jgi:glycosyltransferase involved in cell wall biosynthesis
VTAARHIAILSSKERCGIQTYSATLADALRSLGHRVDLVGVGWWDSGELFREAGRVAAGVVIVEHEFALYRNLALAVAMARMKLSGKRVLLSMHELEPDKFWNYHKVVAALHYKMRGSVLGDLARLVWATVEAAQRMLRYRLSLWAIGAFADRIVFHSPRATANAGLVTGDARKVVEIPHFVEPLPAVGDPGAVRTGELRERLGLPLERFIFVAPGFIVRRKRLIEVIDATPPDAMLVIAGTESPHDEGYLEEVRRYVETRGLTNVLIDTDYDRMPLHVMAADAVVLFYRDAFQSGVASNAIWAERPLIVPDDPAFEMYGGAALRASSEEGLRQAMEEIQRPDVAERLRAEARRLKRELSPEAMAQRYVDAIPL